MKKSILLFSVLLGFTFVLSSCSKGECCDCAGNIEVCEDDWNNAGGVSWEEYKDAANCTSCD